jgi:hypothetical protein
MAADVPSPTGASPGNAHGDADSGFAVTGQTWARTQLLVDSAMPFRTRCSSVGTSKDRIARKRQFRNHTSFVERVDLEQPTFILYDMS